MSMIQRISSVLRIIEMPRVSNDIRETDYRGYQEKKPHEGGHYHKYHGKLGYLVVLRITDILNAHPNTTLVVLGYHWSPG